MILKLFFNVNIVIMNLKHGGYDDSNYWLNVIPNAICPKCGINSNGEDAEQLKQRLGRTYKI